MKRDVEVVQTVEKYIAQFPAETQKKLKQMRALIKAAAPKAEERISYGMVGYKYLGRSLVYFGGYKAHVGFYGASSTFFKKYEKELEGFEYSKGTIRLPLDKPLPVALIKNMVKERVKQNEQGKK